MADADRLLFRSALGLPEPWATLREVPLSGAFCEHVVATGAPLRVGDARRDPLAYGDLVVPEFGFVAYLRTPLTTADSHALGALCAIDMEPRNWAAEDAASLSDLATRAMDAVSLRALALELEAGLRGRDGETAACRRLTRPVRPPDAAGCARVRRDPPR